MAARPVQVQFTNGKMALWLGGYYHPTRLLAAIPEPPPPKDAPRLVKAGVRPRPKKQG